MYFALVLAALIMFCLVLYGFGLERKQLTTTQNYAEPCKRSETSTDQQKTTQNHTSTARPAKTNKKQQGYLSQVRKGEKRGDTRRAPPDDYIPINYACIFFPETLHAVILHMPSFRFVTQNNRKPCKTQRDQQRPAQARSFHMHLLVSGSELWVFCALAPRAGPRGPAAPADKQTSGPRSLLDGLPHSMDLRYQGLPLPLDTSASSGRVLAKLERRMRGRGEAPRPT